MAVHPQTCPAHGEFRLVEVGVIRILRCGGEARLDPKAQPHHEVIFLIAEHDAIFKSQIEFFRLQVLSEGSLEEKKKNNHA